MYQENEQRYGTEAPRCGPGPPPKTFYLKQALRRSKDEVYRLTHLVKDLKSFKRDSEIERDSFCLVIKDGKLATAHLKKSLEAANERIKILESQHMSMAEANNSREMQSQNLHLLERLRVQEEKMAEAQLIHHQEKERMVQEYEDKLSEQISQILDLFKKNEGFSNESWQQRYEDLEKKTTQDLALKQEALGALQVQHQQLITEVENLMLQKINEIVEVNKEKESISHKLSMTQQQLISEEEKFKDLERWIGKELNYKQDVYKARIAGLYADKISLEDQLNKQWANHHQLEEENKQLKHWRDSMPEKQDSYETRIVGLVADNIALEDQMVVQLANHFQLEEENQQLKHWKDSTSEKQNSYETRIAGLCANNIALEEQLNMQWANQHQLEEEYKQLKHCRDSTSEKQKKDAYLIASLLQEVDVMTEQNHIVIKDVKQLRKENTLLENICLDMKKKKRGLFGRKMQDRKTELTKMKRKRLCKDVKRLERKIKEEKRKNNTFKG
ncbi:uncharacterized protein LOC144405521 [Gasterosteus aculeatus]